MLSSVALLSTVLAFTSAQQVGTQTAEVHPPLTWETCTASGCTPASGGEIVLDANWRWLHTTSGYTNCYTGNTWDTTLCPDPKTCAANCALDGANYSGTYGITTTGSTLRLNFVTTSNGNTNVGSRTYLSDNATNYHIFHPLGMEFTMDVNVANLPCGLNGAVYFSEMASDGGKSKYSTNKAGAQYGTGYCDSQCPRDLKFINGVANVQGWTPDSNSANSGTGGTGSCCNEMDIWEANSISTAYTPHPCNVVGQTACTGDDCGYPSRYSGVCDPDGCDFNSFRMGDQSFYGPGMVIDTTKPFTVVTQFITDDGTTTGTLIDIKRFYVQNGVTYENTFVNIPGMDPTLNSVSTAFCQQQKAAFNDTDSFGNHGGLKTMGESLGRGVVLVLSVWDDYAVNMLWLDSDYPTSADPSTPGIARGSCAQTSGVPATVEKQNANAYVTYANIKFGPINSTFPATNAVVPPGQSVSGSVAVTRTTPTSTKTTSTPAQNLHVTTTSTSKPTTSAKPPTTTPKPTTTSSKTSSANSAGQTKYGQCAGIGYSGPTQCINSTCKLSNAYYSQCL